MGEKTLVEGKRIQEFFECTCYRIMLDWYLNIPGVIVADGAVVVTVGKPGLRVRDGHRAERVLDHLRVLTSRSHLRIRPSVWTFVFDVDVAVLMFNVIKNIRLKKNIEQRLYVN